VARPFINAGIDYVGPFEIKSGNTRSKTTTKCYVALFICMATKVIHLELVSPARNASAASRRQLTSHVLETRNY